jgi:protoporphyrinogen oxidase
MEFFKIIVVGGGAAGLGAAKTLRAATNYVLLEAADYLGGRIRTVDAGCCSYSRFVHPSCSFLLAVDEQFRMS